MKINEEKWMEDRESCPCYKLFTKICTAKSFQSFYLYCDKYEECQFVFWSERIRPVE